MDRRKRKNSGRKSAAARRLGFNRYEPSGMYFARLRFRSTLVRRKLDTTDFAIAKRKLSDFRRDLERTDATKGNMSFAAVLQLAQ